ncbi:MAG TPA: hypothetical protein ENN97_06095 [Phycisphaerales bacterium]|nr:hypothetical protein [Phycisphaerales bacterium]
MKRKWILLLAAVCIWAGGASAAIRVDNFDDYEAGQVDVVTENWTAVPVDYEGSFIAADPLDPTNRILGSTGGGSNVGRGAYMLLPEEAIIPNGQTKTLFLRFRASAGTDHSFGLSPAAEPGWFDVYRAQLFAIGGQFGVRDGGTTQPRLPIQTGDDVPFYNVWMIVNNDTNTTKVYLHQDGDSPATEAHRVVLDGRDTFNFRAANSEPLISFFFFSYNNTGTVWLDDLYMMDGENLSNPLRQAAHDPSPADGETGVLLEDILTWKTGLDPENLDQVNPDITHHYLYFREDPNFAEMTTPTAIIEVDGPTASFDPAGLERDKTYYWRVDEILYGGPAGDPNNVIQGALWRFNTILSVPVIKQDGHPEMAFAEIGDDVAFEVNYTSYSPASARWYRYVDGENDEPLTDDFGIPLDPSKHVVQNDGTSETTLTVLNVTEADQAQYYCVIANAEELQDVSDRASLIIKRLLAHYPFEDDFVDLVNGAFGIGLNYPDANLPGPTFVDGIDGRAAWFTAGNYVDLGVEAFPKAGVGNGMEAATISVWVNPTVAGNLVANFNDNIDPQGDNLGTTGFALSLAGSQPRIIVRGEPIDGVYYEMGTLQAGGSPVGLNDEAWYLVTTTWQAGDHMRLYVNGVEVASMTNVGTPEEYLDWNRGVLLGAARTMADRGVPSVGYAGGMDDLRIYNYPKDRYEIAQMYYDITGDGPCIEDYASQFDLNNDCRIDLKDFVLLAADWLSCGRFPLEACHE